MSEELKFPYTADGYLDAKKWLIENGFWNQSQKGFSTDGWSVIQFANDKFNSTK